METLLSLTSKRAGDWFKEELRLLGGLDHIVDKGTLLEYICILFVRLLKEMPRNMFLLPSVKECVENLSKEEDKESLVASLWGAERCLRVLESVSGQQINDKIIII